MDSRFTRIKARYLFLWFVVTTILAIIVIGAAGLFSSIGSRDADGVLAEAGLAWVSYLLLLAVTIPYASRGGVGFASSFGACPSLAETGRISVIGIPLVAVAIVVVYVVFAPLSLLWPEAVQSWLFDYIPNAYSARKPYPLAANLLGLSAIVIVAPVTEEWFFRGLLLRRLTLKWGTAPGVVISSLAFGLMHTDIIGATFFGIVMCALYARRGYLWAPVIAHAANNAIAAGFVVLGAHGILDPDAVSVQHLRADWVSPLIALVVASLWLPRAWAAWQPMSQWQFGATPSTEMELPRSSIA